MKLYRGVKSIPKFFVPKLQEEYGLLKDAIKDFADLRSLPAAKIQQYVLLRQIRGEQHFTDQKMIALGYAGEDGYILEIDIDHETATDHYSGEEIVGATEKGQLVSSNFVFDGYELYELVSTGKVDVYPAKESVDEVTKELTEEGSKDHLRDTIYNHDQLSSDDAEAIGRLRDGRVDEPPTFGGPEK